MINEVDANGKGTVQFPQFLLMMAKKASELDAEDEIQEAFSVFDRDGNGTLSRNEFSAVLANIGEDITSEEMEGMYVPFRKYKCGFLIFFLNSRFRWVTTKKQGNFLAGFSCLMFSALFRH